MYNRHQTTPIRKTLLLARSNQHPLLLRIWCPSARSGFTPVLLRPPSDPLFKLGPEMSDETLQRPREGFTQCCARNQLPTPSVVQDGERGGEGWESYLPQIVCPSTCLVNSCSISISLSRAIPASNLFMICSVHLLPSLHGVHCPQLSCL